MHHIYQEGQSEDTRTLLLLHGTGGNEEDLLPVGRMLDDAAAMLGVRGEVLENGMPRFFKRLAEGVFDEEDLIERTAALKQFLDETNEKKGIDPVQLIAVGYSNGANIAGSLLFHYGKVMGGAILFHAMVPRRGLTLPDLSGLPVFIAAGRHDPICPPEESETLAEMLRGAGADVTLHWSDHSHQLTQEEVYAAKNWLHSKF